VHKLDSCIDLCLVVCIRTFWTNIARVWLFASERVLEKSTQINVSILYSMCVLVLYQKYQKHKYEIRSVIKSFIYKIY
jgi:hypothetical protein